MNATLVSVEERIAAPHGSRANRRAVEHVKISVRQRRIVGNLNVTHDPCRPRSHNRNPILAIPVCDVVLERGAVRGEDQYASTGVPVNNVMTHRTHRTQSPIVDYTDTCAVAAYVIFRNRAQESVTRSMPMTFRPRVFAVIVREVDSSATMPLPTPAL